MAQLKEFQQSINLKVPGVAWLIVQPHVLNVLRDFCEKSRILQLSLGPFPVNGESYVDLVQLAQVQLDEESADIVDVLSVSVGNQLVPDSSYRRFARKGIEWIGEPAGDFTVRVSVKPRRSASTVNDMLIDNWDEAIAHGVAAALKMQPDQGWTDPGAGQWHRNEYEVLRNRALFEANNGRQTIQHGKRLTFY